MAEKKKLSVQEMLALARKQGAGGGGGASESAPPAEEAKPEPAASEPVAAAPAAEEAPATEAPPAPVAEKKPAAPKPASGGKLSVAEMLAAARAQGAQKAGGAAPAAAPKPPAEKKEPAAKPAAAAEKKEKPSAPVVGGAKDTASILAAARKTAKPGPITKAEAAAKEKPEPVAKAATKGVVPPMPAKPDYAKPKPAKAAPEGESRRGFVGLMLGSMLSVGYTAMAATAGLWTLGFARFMFPNILTEPPSKFKVGFPGDFAPGKVEEKFKAQFGVWIVNTEYNGTPEIFALRTVCTHLGCTPNWLEAEQKFKCPCHGSGFYKDGINFEGPAPRPLERYAISVADDGQLEVDKSKLFFEEMGQWVDTSSYVPV
jgi:cytochrome b6-f complex iron-sulfur subunit